MTSEMSLHVLSLVSSLCDEVEIKLSALDSAFRTDPSPPFS